MSIEDFDFKPMTEGLGFDKKAEEVKHETIQRSIQSEPVEAKKEMPNPTPVSRSLQKMLDSLPPSLDFVEDNKREESFHPAKPAVQAPTAKPAPAAAAPAVAHARAGFDITLNNSIEKAFPKAELEKRFYHQTVVPQPQFKEVSSSFASAILDALIVFGLTSIFVVFLVLITGIDLVQMIQQQQLGFRVALEVTALYFGTMLIYFMVSRSLWGSTLGDWAFDVQLGDSKQRLHIMYPFQVLFRQFVIVLTGVFIIPLISIAFGKDIAFHFSGLKLYCKQY